jgi:uncharacterized protein
MRASRLWLLAGALLAAGCGGDAEADRAAPSNVVSAAALPALTGPVVDEADLIPPAREKRLAARLAELEKRTGRPLVVVTWVSLGAEPIEDFGRRLGTAWAVGGKDRHDGVLLIVAPNERKVRIATGAGLRPVLTDAMCAEIIDRDILPRFRRGEMLEGIEAGAAAVSRRLLDAGQPPRKAA